MKLQNRLAFITGGGRGIGRAIALEFAREGASVGVAARTVEQVEAVAREVSELGVDGLALKCDVQNTGWVNDAFAAFRAHFGRGPDIVVNNAGIASLSCSSRVTSRCGNVISTQTWVGPGAALMPDFLR
jgi:3-oxoacyl-[acyl-carrier protein] reductase